MNRRTRKIDRWNIFLRCFVIQASWNFKSLLGLGFCFSIIPLARRLFRTAEERSAFLRRHLEFFNAHPYFASWCLGAVTRLEEDAIEEKWPDKHPISVFKNRLSGPLGAVGDQLFWSRLKPLSSAVAVGIALLYGWIAVPVFLILYNTPHFVIRIQGMKKGYAQGFDVTAILAKRRFKNISTALSIVGLALTGILFMIVADWSLLRHQAVFTAFWSSALIALILIRLKKSVHVIITAVFLTSFLIGWLYFL
jgi:mannose PTS system EIID component